MKSTKFTESQIFKILKEAESGIAVPDLYRQHGVARATFYKWRARFGGMDTAMVRHLRALEQEKSCL